MCAENLSKQFDLIFLDRENMDTSVKNLTLVDRMLITSSIFLQRRKMSLYWKAHFCQELAKKPYNVST